MDNKVFHICAGCSMSGTIECEVNVKRIPVRVVPDDGDGEKTFEAEKLCVEFGLLEGWKEITIRRMAQVAILTKKTWEEFPDYSRRTGYFVEPGPAFYYEDTPVLVCSRPCEILVRANNKTMMDIAAVAVSKAYGHG